MSEHSGLLLALRPASIPIKSHEDMIAWPGNPREAASPHRSGPKEKTNGI